MLCQLAQFFKDPVQKSNNFQFCKIYVDKKGKNNPFPFLFFVVVVSGIEKNLDPGSGINIPDPQHWLINYPLRENRQLNFFSVTVQNLMPIC
jgi:hypothetical protein